MAIDMIKSVGEVLSPCYERCKHYAGIGVYFAARHWITPFPDHLIRGSNWHKVQMQLSSGYSRNMLRHIPSNSLYKQISPDWLGVRHLGMVASIIPLSLASCARSVLSSAMLIISKTWTIGEGYWVNRNNENFSLSIYLKNSGNDYLPCAEQFGEGLMFLVNGVGIFGVSSYGIYNPPKALSLLNSWENYCFKGIQKNSKIDNSTVFKIANGVTKGHIRPSQLFGMQALGTYDPENDVSSREELPVVEDARVRAIRSPRRLSVVGDAIVAIGENQIERSAAGTDRRLSMARVLLHSLDETSTDTGGESSPGAGVWSSRVDKQVVRSDADDDEPGSPPASVLISEPSSPAPPGEPPSGASSLLEGSYVRL
ncbi:MAG: hypothetical protein KR126chlam1_00396 [Chlamydiae bacterium]|nr:hypothetical protein [Chlamydiota bacterium]